MNSTNKKIIEKFDKEILEIERKKGTRNDYITIFYEVDNKSFKHNGRLIDFDSEYFIFSNPNTGGKVFIPKNFYAGCSEVHIDFNTINEMVGKDISLVHLNDHDEREYTGRLKDLDSDFLVFKEGKKIPKNEVVDWYVPRKKDLIGKLGY